MLTKISNGFFKPTRIYFPYKAKRTFPVGCTKTHVYVIFEQEHGGMFNLAVLRIEREILRTPHQCEFQDRTPYHSPWVINTNAFDDFKFAFIWKDTIGVFMKDRLCMMKASGSLDWFVYKRYHKIHSACMNDTFIFICYNVEFDGSHIDLLDKKSGALIHTRTWGDPINYVTFSQNSTSNDIFFFENKDDVYFKLWTLSASEPFMRPHECVMDRIRIGREDGDSGLNCTISALESESLIFHGTTNEMCLYHPSRGVDRYDMSERSPIFSYFWRDWGVLIIHDIRNDVHFLDVFKGGLVDVTFLSMLHEGTLNAVGKGMGFSTPRPTYSYPSIIQIKSDILGLLEPDGTFIVIDYQMPPTRR